MTNRRGGRPSQVRPRPPSTGRPAPTKVRARGPHPGRIAPHRRVGDRRGLPMAARLLLVVAVASLGAVVLYTANGGLGKIVEAAGTRVGGFLDDLAATPSPTPVLAVVSDAPVIEAPDEPYTNQPAVDLVVTVPADALADRTNLLRLYLALAGQDPATILEVPLGTTPRLIIPDVELTPGANAFTATLAGAGGESDPSPVVTYVLDQTKPKITLTSPRNGATVNRPAVTVSGRTQGRSALVASNEANNASVTGVAAADGSFELSLAIDPGPNGIRIRATDPAGNVNELVVSVRRGSGRLTASISASTYRLRASRLPDPLEVTVGVTDPDGQALEGAVVTFVITIPGLPPVTSDTVTRGDGRATFRTTVPKGASQGTIGVTALVSTDDFGSTTARTVVTIAK